MLTLMLPAIDGEEVVTLQLEHSLASLSKWESFHKKPFHSNDPKTEAEFRSYLEMMIVSPDAPANCAELFEVEHIMTAQEYINESQTATTFREDPNQPASREVITAEIIYYWLITFNIPFQPCENWHLSRVMTLVRVCGLKQTKPKKMSRQQQMAEMKRLNDQRRKDMGTSG